MPRRRHSNPVLRRPLMFPNDTRNLRRSLKICESHGEIVLYTRPEAKNQNPPPKAPIDITSPSVNNRSRHARAALASEIVAWSTHRRSSNSRSPISIPTHHQTSRNSDGHSTSFTAPSYPFHPPYPAIIIPTRTSPPSQTPTTATSSADDWWEH